MKRKSERMIERKTERGKKNKKVGNKCRLKVSRFDTKNAVRQCFDVLYDVPTFFASPFPDSLVLGNNSRFIRTKQRANS
jgi:hypothetical protein